MGRLECEGMLCLVLHEKSGSKSWPLNSDDDLLRAAFQPPDFKYSISSLLFKSEQNSVDKCVEFNKLYHQTAPHIDSCFLKTLCTKACYL